MADPTPGSDGALWQGLAAIGALIAGFVAGLLGKRKKPSDDDGDEPSYREQLREERFERKMEQTLAAHRRGLETTFIEFQNTIYEKLNSLSEERRGETRDLDQRLRDVEKGRHQR